MIPISFNLYLTDHCTLKCRHCSHRSSRYFPNDMTRAEITFALRFILKAVRHYDVGVIGLSGGEPLLSPHFTFVCETLAEALYAMKATTHLELHTNGTVRPPAELLLRFSNIYIGHDVFHREQVPVKKLFLDELSRLGNVTLRWANCIRDKGCSKALLRQYKMPFIKQYCQLAEADRVLINFAPGHIRFCMENSQDYSNVHAFAEYKTKYQDNILLLIDKSIDFMHSHVGTNCTTPCHLYHTVLEEKNETAAL